MIIGPSAGISSSTSPLTQVSPSTSTTPTTSGGVTSTTVGNTTTVTGSGSPDTNARLDDAVHDRCPGTPVAIEQIVSVTRTVEAGAPVSAFAVPAGNRLVVTDVVITNPATTPACGAGIGAGAATTAHHERHRPRARRPRRAPRRPAHDHRRRTTGDDRCGDGKRGRLMLASTGVLCVPAQTSLTLALTTGLEFASGQSVVLSNQVIAGGTTTSGGPLFYHLRGFLISGV